MNRLFSCNPILWCAALLAACAGPLHAQTSPAGMAAPASGSLLTLDAGAFEVTPRDSAASENAATPPAAPASAAAVSDVVAPSDPVNPDQPVNLGDEQANVDLWTRVRRGFGITDLSDDFVRNREQFYATKPDYIKRMTERGGRYLFHILEEVERRGMPSELALLPFIESAFNPQAMSSARASGMWQFIPSTGKTFALKQNVFRDDRRDVLASTRAALDYLGRLKNMFGDWHLALAAYNWGEGNVQRAIARNQKAGLPTDYSSLRMPDETRYYVPKLQAIKNIVAQPDAYNLSLPALKNHPYFLSVPISRDMDVSVAARLAGVSEDEFKQLNPQMNKPVILAAGTEQVLLPYDNATLFVQNIKEHKGPLATWTAWVAPRTLRPADAAKQVGMSESQLRDVNRIPPRMLVKAGSTLLVPRTAGRNVDVSEHLADNATMELAPDLPPMRRLTLRAGKRGESVASVAKRYKVSPAQVAQWNHLRVGDSFKPSSTIIVMVPNSRKATLTRAPASRHAAAPSRGNRPQAQVRPSRTVKATRARR